MATKIYQFKTFFEAKRLYGSVHNYRAILAAMDKILISQTRYRYLTTRRENHEEEKNPEKK